MASPRLIAIVEDDAPVRLALGSLLRSAGYDASQHESAEEFLTSVAFGHASCIVTDIQLPGISGIDLKQVLVALGFHTPVIMITARPEALALAPEAFCLLQKPFAATELMDCLNRALTV